MNLPPYQNFPQIIGERVTLRQIYASDFNVIEACEYDGLKARSTQHLQAIQARVNRDYLSGTSIHWGISDNKTHQIVGTCGFYHGFEDGTGELGCVLSPKYRGKGFMAAAMRLAIDFGMRHMYLKSIWATTTVDNAPAINLLERLNFEHVARPNTNNLFYLFR